MTEDGRTVSPGSGDTGLIALPSTAAGYHNDRTKTAATFTQIDGHPYTIPGDMATVADNGDLILLGRGSACINTAGEKVYPEEVEEVLKTHPAVEDALVFGIDDDHYGQKVVAVVSRFAGTNEPLDNILGHARTKLAGYKLPRAVHIVTQVPRTPVGKADYPTARELFTTSQHQN
ncbi:hypothetical protein [Nocardia sp. NPDC046763]|uniref:AMP-binding enzyme n=1 Tax=Nocardia sp. NPDC046763 TaxID=3155256 RepID=UPI0033D3F9C6